MVWHDDRLITVFQITCPEISIGDVLVWKLEFLEDKPGPAFIRARNPGFIQTESNALNCLSVDLRFPGYGDDFKIKLPSQFFHVTSF